MEDFDTARQEVASHLTKYLRESSEFDAQQVVLLLINAAGPNFILSYYRQMEKKEKQNDGTI